MQKIIMFDLDGTLTASHWQVRKSSLPGGP